MTTAETATGPVVVDGESLTVDALRRVAESGTRVEVHAEAMEKVLRSRASLESMIIRGEPVPGAVGGEGRDSPPGVDVTGESERQTNLVRSHSVGVGPLYAEDEARAMVTARLNSLAKGHSAVRPDLLDRMVLYLNEGVVPAVPEIGSPGPVDLVPLAHVASTLIGEGHVLHDGRRQETRRVLGAMGVAPLRLGVKEGTALINGTSGTVGLGALVVARALDQVRQAEITSALFADAVRGAGSPFLAEGHDAAPPHRGQTNSAANLRDLLANSRGSGEAEHGGAVPGFRRPQVHEHYTVAQVLGAARDALRHAREELETELNSANDEPLFFPDGKVLHGKTAPGQAVALALEFVTIALSHVGELVERQIDRMLTRHPDSGVPRYLVAADPTLHHGFAGVGHTARALTAENRTVGTAAAQAVTAFGNERSTAGTGLLAARNARRVLQNNDRIIATGLIAAAQTADLSRGFDDLSRANMATYDMVRALVPPLGVDRSMAQDVELIATALSRAEFLHLLRRQEGIVLR
ncbi:tyrosine 2,3-aminomutase [Streptomyces sp. AD681]|uniref:tyrosine 2,3-aminomutase n=1 Tax=Streptomyces sp. AD681 TaxID=3019069 RepID=UPI0022F190B2|nr:tyrosine 2,3-aminomutase [Streptomyces sp. AD681]MDA5145892.1 tyrosine 2,3-aminomutase [Streptomyces sp. AD681]